MTDQILPNEILREIVHNCPQCERLKLAMTFREVSKSFDDILELSTNPVVYTGLSHKCAIFTIYADTYSSSVRNSTLSICRKNPPIYIELTRAHAPEIRVVNDQYRCALITHFQRGHFVVQSTSDVFRKYIGDYDHAADTYPDRKHPMGLAQKIFWKTCKYYIPPVIVQFIYDQVQLMERQLRGQ